MQESARLDDQVLTSLDALVIATPMGARADLARHCLDAGKHVLVEAPTATSADVVRELEACAVRRGLVFATGYRRSAFSDWARIRELVDGGRLGRIHFIDAVREGLGEYRSGADVLWDLGPVPVAMVNHVLGAFPSRATGWGRAFIHRDVHDVVDVMFEYAETDVSFRMRLSWLSPARTRRLTFVGTRGMLVYEVAQGESTLTFHHKHVAVDTTGSRPSEDTTFIHRRGRAEPLDLPSTDAVVALDTAFTGAIRGQRDLPAQLQRGADVVDALAVGRRSLDETRPSRIAAHRSRSFEDASA